LRDTTILDCSDRENTLLENSCTSTTTFASYWET